jgi:hypothetical protein
MERMIILAGVVVAALIVAFIILRIVVSFVSSIPKWVYALVIFAALIGAVSIVFGTTVFDAFSEVIR